MNNIIDVGQEAARLGYPYETGVYGLLGGEELVHEYKNPKTGERAWVGRGNRGQLITVPEKYEFLVTNTRRMK